MPYCIFSLNINVQVIYVHNFTQPHYCTSLGDQTIVISGVAAGGRVDGVSSEGVVVGNWSWGCNILTKRFWKRLMIFS